MSTYTSMPNTTHNIPVELTTIQCGKCGGVYAINERFREKCQENGTGWHCPFCQCSWGYFKDNDNAKLKAEVARLKTAEQYQRERRQEAEQQALHYRKSRDGVKGVLAKERKRVGKGVCPCCNRTFTDLQRHMASEHPQHADYPIHDQQ